MEQQYWKSKTLFFKNMKRKITLCIIMLLSSITVFSQRQTELKGNVINSATKMPVAGVLVTLIGQNQTKTTDAQGEFHFIGVVPGDDILSVSSSNVTSLEIPVKIEPNTLTVTNDIALYVIESKDNLSLTGVIDDATVDDDVDGMSQEISSMIILSNDVYLNKVGYQLSSLRFKIRGYDNIYQEKYINGVKFNDQNRGKFNYSSIGALNDVTRNGDVVNYFAPSIFTFGTIGGAENLNMRAGSFTKGGKISMSYTNKNYNYRGMATYSTGLMDDGYAYTISIGGRYADEGYIEGTSYKNFSYAFSLEKQLNNGKHSITFTTFGSPVERWAQAGTYEEIYDLAGKKYNPNWGYQNGKKRNAKVIKAFDPTGIVSHIWKINRNATLTSGIGVHYSLDKRTALNWYKGADPRPDYYRYLPSYQGNEVAKEFYTNLWKSGDKSFTQINWDKMIHINQTNEDLVYMVEARHNDLLEGTFNSTFNLNIKDNIKLTAGIEARKSKLKQYKTVEDLLGAKFLKDIDKYAERDFAGNSEIKQNDLNHPDRIVYTNDVFGYNYHLDIHSANAWLQQQFITAKVDYYFGAKVSYTEFARKGRMKNGRYPTNSYGKGKTHDFIDFAFKGGLTYKITGRHFITANANIMTNAPTPYIAYTSPRITDKTVDLKSGKVISMDINYIFSLPQLSGRISLYQTLFFDQMHRISYYNDFQKTYVNHIITGMDKINRGIEIGLNYKITDIWSVSLAGTVAEYYYSNNPKGTVSYENNVKDDVSETVYLNNYYVGGTPQIAGTLGLNYFYKYWFINLNVNGFARNHVDIAPIRRLASNYKTINPNNPEQFEAYKKIIRQERYGSGYTVDLSIGKTIYLPKRQSLNFSFAFNNILDRRNIKTGGYENGRFDISYSDRFSAKYYYMQGFNCFLNAGYRF